jgi:hypothetical protein
MKAVVWGVICLACAVSGHLVLGLLGALLLAACVSWKRPDTAEHIVHTGRTTSGDSVQAP